MPLSCIYLIDTLLTGPLSCIYLIDTLLTGPLSCLYQIDTPLTWPLSCIYLVDTLITGPLSCVQNHYFWKRNIWTMQDLYGKEQNYYSASRLVNTVLIMLFTSFSHNADGELIHFLKFL